MFTFNSNLRALFLTAAWNTKSKRDSRCLHNSAGVIKTREAVHARSQLSSAGNQISLVTVSSPRFWTGYHEIHMASFLCLCRHLGVWRCIRGDRCGGSRHLRREWRCRQLLMASSNLQNLISTHPRAAQILSHHPVFLFFIAAKISSTSSCHLGHWVWERRNNPGRRKSGYYLLNPGRRRFTKLSPLLSVGSAGWNSWGRSDKANHNLVPSLSVPLTPTQQTKRRKNIRLINIISALIQGPLADNVLKGACK